MNLEELIESHFAPKKGNDLIIQLIENKLNEAFGTDELTLSVGSANFTTCLIGFEIKEFLFKKYEEKERSKEVKDVMHRMYGEDK